MKKRKKDLLNREMLNNIHIIAIRKEKVRQGFFDGRYKTKTVPSKKLYKRYKIKFELF